MRKRVVLIGGGGHASDILAAYEAVSRKSGIPHPVIGIVDDSEVSPHRFVGRGVKQIGSLDDLPRIDATHYVLAIGWPKVREQVFNRISSCGLSADTVIDPSADIPPGVAIGEGTVILDGVHVSVTASVGKHVYLSHSALVTHDCTVGDFASIMPFASICGATHVGRGCLLGTHAAVIENRRIGDYAIIGAGAVVVRDIPDGVTAIGSPARWNARAIAA